MSNSSRLKSLSLTTPALRVPHPGSEIPSKHRLTGEPGLQSLPGCFVLRRKWQSNPSCRPLKTEMHVCNRPRERSIDSR